MQYLRKLIVIIFIGISLLLLSGCDSLGVGYTYGSGYYGNPYHYYYGTHYRGYHPTYYRGSRGFHYRGHHRYNYHSTPYYLHR